MLATKEQCTACAAVCPRGCITMAADAYGFPYPVVDGDSCIGCGLCETVCPVLSPQKCVHSPAAYAAQSRDECLRWESSSGGVFSELARAVLAQGGAVFGAAYDETFQVVHRCVEREADLAALRGAKYAQSHLGTTFAQVQQRLKTGQTVLFSGTPCQVTGLRAFLRQDYPNLITVDFVCHGVPAPLAWREYVTYRTGRDRGGKAPQAINLRSKVSGWSRYRYCNVFSYPDGTCHAQQSSQSLFMKLFVEDFINRESCACCPCKGYSRVSDFTLGDFWGIWDILPELDDDKGTSLVLVQSEKGQRLWGQISPGLTLCPVTLEQASAQNPSLLSSSAAHPNRAQALERIRGGDIAACEAFLSPGSASKLKSILKKLLKR